MSNEYTISSMPSSCATCCSSIVSLFRSNNPKIPNSAIIPSGTVQTVLIFVPALVMTVFIYARVLIQIQLWLFLHKSSVYINVMFIPKRARKLSDLVWTISSPNESSDEDIDFTHDKLMDEDIEFRRVTCAYLRHS